ncbi:MAG: heavy metal-associated domain-containing protein [Pseudomonadota bacterium]|nr:heavy metal-associated domain-containing protein [Pseudomonadota bacterium]
MTTQNDTLLAVEGMTCHSCVSHVRRALMGVDGVETVDVRLSEGKVRVTHAAAAAPAPELVQELVEALAEAGYAATPAA